MGGVGGCGGVGGRGGVWGKEATCTYRSCLFPWTPLCRSPSIEERGGGRGGGGGGGGGDAGVAGTDEAINLPPDSCQPPRWPNLQISCFLVRAVHFPATRDLSYLPQAESGVRRPIPAEVVEAREESD